MEDSDESEVLEVAGIDLRREVGGQHGLHLCLPVASHETAKQEKKNSLSNSSDHRRAQRENRSADSQNKTAQIQTGGKTKRAILGAQTISYGIRRKGR